MPRNDIQQKTTLQMGVFNHHELNRVMRLVERRLDELEGTKITVKDDSKVPVIDTKNAVFSLRLHPQSGLMKDGEVLPTLKVQAESGKGIEVTEAGIGVKQQDQVETLTDGATVTVNTGGTEHVNLSSLQANITELVNRINACQQKVNEVIGSLEKAEILFSQ